MNAGYFGQYNEGAAETTAGNIISALGYANGGAFGPSGEYTAFANGGVVTSPTMFRFANGVGLMGEAGDEAIMPLRRTASGKLGVETTGGSKSVVVNQTVMVQGLSNRRTREQLAQETARRQQIAVTRNG